jgi:protoporphyrinogen oxidase
MAEQEYAVIGGGPMGLAAAYYLGKQGKRVTVYETGDRVGGMTASLRLL